MWIEGPGIGDPFPSPRTWLACRSFFDLSEG
jgi:hypothetical protein